MFFRDEVQRPRRVGMVTCVHGVWLGRCLDIPVPCSTYKQGGKCVWKASGKIEVIDGRARRAGIHGSGVQKQKQKQKAESNVRFVEDMWFLDWYCVMGWIVK
jgi:hypothetical protein